MEEFAELVGPDLEALKESSRGPFGTPETPLDRIGINIRAVFTKFAAVIDENAKKTAALEKELAELRQKLKDQEPKPE
jgi:hypothetical protein